MIDALKQHLAMLAVRFAINSGNSNQSKLQAILDRAAQVSLGKLDQEDFRRHLAAYYSELHRDELFDQIQFSKHRDALKSPGGYKSRILSTAGEIEARPSWPRPLWRRRFSLLSRLGIDCDVMILREGATVPPHGHCQVVSGFYVLEGKVAVRHYDRIEDRGDHLIVRKTIDTDFGPGGFTTNSEYCDNIHWLEGLAPESFLFRLNVKNVPVKPFSLPRGHSERIYVAPEEVADASGRIVARFVSEQHASTLTITRQRTCAA